MEGNDWTYYPLFSDKEFLNEDWHKYTCIESCAAMGNARHGCESLGTDIQSIREIDDSGSTLVSEIGNMMTNITGSSILKSTGHTSQVKPGKLSVRFILSDREPCSADPSSRFERTFDSKQSEVVSTDESEIGIVSESEDDWYSCESSDDEDEYFYDAVSLVNSHDASLSSLPHQVTETPCETNLDGLALGCRQPSNQKATFLDHDRRLMMDTLYTPLTIKLISLLFLDSKPPNSLDTLMNVWCLGWISKIRSRERISLILSIFKFYLQKCQITNMVELELTPIHLCLRHIVQGC